MPKHGTGQKEIAYKRQKGQNMRQIKTLVRKEILDILRDKKTLIMMVVVPVLLYPLLLIGMTMIMGAMVQSQEETVHTVYYPREQVQFADNLERLYEVHQEELEWKMEFSGVSEKEDAEEGTVWMEISENGKLDDGTEEKKTTEDLKTELHVAISYSSSNSDARYTMQALSELLDYYQEEMVIEKLEAEGFDEAFLTPFTYEAVDLSSASESFGMDMGGSIGMMLIVTILLGAMYPAIDATAGEKERGTLETLLTLPVTNFQMILSKYISVAVFACITAIISLLSLGGSVLFLIYGFSTEIVEEFQGITPGTILMILPVLLITMITAALLVTALCMCFCVFAKSFKEANNYITPVLLVVMFASMAGMIPSIVLDYKTAMIPVVNVSLMLKQVISGQFDLMLAGITILVNLGYSVLIIWILAKIYNSEDILFSDGFVRFKLFEKRSAIAPGTTPDTGDLLVSITALFLLLLYVGTAASVHLGFWGTAVSQLLILAVPILVVWYMKSDAKKLFSMKKPVLSKIPGSISLYIGTYCLVMAISSVLTRWMTESTQNLNESFEMVMEQPFLIILLVIAVMPAIGEEILFRGFLMGSLKERLGGKWALVISALVFGAFHMSLVKLLPTALLGVSFAYIVQQTGSIYVTMALHFINNAVSVLVMKFPEQALKVVPFLAKEQLEAKEVALLLAVGLILAVLGMVLMRKEKKA